MINHNDENVKSSGFIVGFILGVAAALLLNSKKGRKILKLLMDQGIERLGNWEDVIKDVIEADDDIIEGDDFVTTSTVDAKKEINPDIKEMPQVPNMPLSSPNENNKTALMVKKATRRFFRGIKKKS
jgi:gas vesicle protein